MDLYLDSIEIRIDGRMWLADSDCHLYRRKVAADGAGDTLRHCLDEVARFARDYLAHGFVQLGIIDEQSWIVGSRASGKGAPDLQIHFETLAQRFLFGIKAVIPEEAHVVKRQSVQGLEASSSIGAEYIRRRCGRQIRLTVTHCVSDILLTSDVFNVKFTYRVRKPY